ncbi:hypothetical protein A0H81_04853 [Grifola frondosa]|uniref:Uncharacterized protein n=1 Tax=Grifola frondosa TaxID=5627 RepID=A0A1C7MER9_GRIFR|nr:hypothetical protein A0H81_04853 [Grifola frondosa]
MATLATTTFLDHLKSIYPARGSLTSEAVLANPWFLVAAVAFSSSNIPEAIPVVFDYALNDLKQAQSHDLTSETAFQERLGLARKLREALLQSGLLSGMPRVISSLIELNKVMPEELREKAVLRNTKKNMAELSAKSVRQRLPRSRLVVQHYWLRSHLRWHFLALAG